VHDLFFPDTHLFSVHLMAEARLSPELQDYPGYPRKLPEERVHPLEKVHYRSA
jgi:hypothetical protein